MLELKRGIAVPNSWVLPDGQVVYERGWLPKRATVESKTSVLMDGEVRQMLTYWDGVERVRLIIPKGGMVDGTF